MITRYLREIQEGKGGGGLKEPEAGGEKTKREF